MSSDVVLRSLKTFESRAISSEFSKLALNQVNGSGYQNTTKKVVKIICSEKVISE